MEIEKHIMDKKHMLKRTASAVLLIIWLSVAFYNGPLWIIISTILIQIECFGEVLSVGLAKISKSSNLQPHPWYLLFVANYFFFGETLARHYWAFIKNSKTFLYLVSYHRFISFCLYFTVLLFHLPGKTKNQECSQFKLLAFIHVVFVIIVFQNYMVVESIFNGLAWLLLLVILMSANDIFAYMCGTLFGRTPLIKISPKKTWEGFIGGAIGTIIVGLIASHIICHFEYLICPVRYVESAGAVIMNTSCRPSNVFLRNTYSVKLADETEFSFSAFPFVFHSLAISSFASVVAPFGGFFASGFKRACKVKHFGNVIPGHGGIMDRFDCYYLMATFMNVYLNTFIKHQDIEDILKKILHLGNNDQLMFYNTLKKSLEIDDLSMKNSTNQWLGIS